MKQFKHLPSLLVFLIVTIFSTSAQESIQFSDTTLKVAKFFNHHGEWVIITKNNKAFYYDKTSKDMTNLDGFKWKYTLSASDFNGKVWFDNEHIYFGNKSNVERVSKADGTLVGPLPFENVNSQPFFDGKYIHLIADYKGKYSQICFEPKKKKVVWAEKTSKDFTSPVYSERFIITRDSTGFPITLSYDKGKVMYPEMYEGSCPFSWIDLFNMYGNDLSDSVFYYNGHVYAVNFYLGFIRQYEPKNYPVPLVTVDMNKFTKRAPFKYIIKPEGSMFYTHQGVQFVSNQELDSLKKIKRMGAMGAPMPTIPISQPHYYKIKSTTQMGDFLDFGRSEFIMFLDNRYYVFEDNAQMIGVSPVGARTYNFPKLYYPIDVYSVQGDIVFYSSEGIPYLLKIKVERIMTDEELKLLEPSPEILKMMQERENQQNPQLAPNPDGNK